MSKNILSILIFLFFISCDNTAIINECFPDVNISTVLNTRLPIYQDLTINGTRDIYLINGRQIFIIRNSASNFIAFDLECPDRNCNQMLDISILPTVTCPCSGNKYNYLQGGILIGGEGCGMLMYDVNLVGELVQIRN